MPTLDARTSWSTESLIGRVFSDRYRVVSRIAQSGGWGVFLADHLLTQRQIALRLRPIDDFPPRLVDAFLEEARTVARIGHDNVTDILHGGRSPDGFIFLATEYLEGKTLAQVLRDGGAMPWERARPILLQIAAGLGAVHAHGIVHGDVRPAKVFLVERNGQDDFVKLLDLGLSKLTGGGELNETGEGAIAGPPDYTAPEQAQGGHGDRRADIYALASVAYEMLTGAPVFEAHSYVELLSKHISEPARPPSARRPDLDVPPDVEAVIMRGLEKDPDRRWQDMATFAEALDRRPTRRTATRSDRTPAAGLAAVGPGGDRDGEDAGAPRTRAGRRLFVGLALAAALVVAGAAWRTFVTAPGHIRISTVPADATVTFNDVPVAMPSPVLLDVPAGQHTLTVARAGFVPVQRVVEISPRRTLEVPIQLEPAPTAQLAHPEDENHEGQQPHALSSP
jgi:eukaryotic-like serine/threonine-protein kinase